MDAASPNESDPAGDPPSGRLRAYLRRSAVDLCVLAIVATAVFSVLGCLGTFFFVGELASHFKPFYLAAALAGTAMLVLLRAWRWALFGAAVVALNAVSVVPWYIAAGETAQGRAGPNLRIALANVHTENTQYGALIEWIEADPPDVLVVQEIDGEWYEELQILKTRYPHCVERPRGDNFGIAVYSRLPLENAGIRLLGDVGVPAVAADLVGEGWAARLIAVHPLPPVSSAYADQRGQQLKEAADIAREVPLCVLAGDLNTTMWSPAHRRLERDSGLRNTRRGFGLLGTWPAFLRPFAIPLDHCLCSPRIEVVRCVRGPHIGSDHLPMLFELRVPKDSGTGLAPQEDSAQRENGPAWKRKPPTTSGRA